MVKRGFAEILQRHRPTHFGCDYNKFLKIKQGRKALKKKVSFIRRIRHYNNL